jgi:hypothetical protein
MMIVGQVRKPSTTRQDGVGCRPGPLNGVPLMLYMNPRYLPRSARPGPASIVMVGIGGAVYIGFASYTVRFKLSSWF